MQFWISWPPSCVVRSSCEVKPEAVVHSAGLQWVRRYKGEELGKLGVKWVRNLSYRFYLNGLVEIIFEVRGWSGKSVCGVQLA